MKTRQHNDTKKPDLLHHYFAPAKLLLGPVHGDMSERHPLWHCSRAGCHRHKLHLPPLLRCKQLEALPRGMARNPGEFITLKTLVHKKSTVSPNCKRFNGASQPWKSKRFKFPGCFLSRLGNHLHKFQATIKAAVGFAPWFTIKSSKPITGETWVTLPFASSRTGRVCLILFQPRVIPIWRSRNSPYRFLVCPNLYRKTQDLRIETFDIRIYTSYASM